MGRRYILAIVILLGAVACVGMWSYTIRAASTIYYVAPGGSDSHNCTNATTQACLSFQRAYEVAASGDIVEVQNGSYDVQIMSYDASKTSTDDVTFEPAAGASPVIGGLKLGQFTLDLGARHLTFKNMTINGFSTQRTQDITFDNVAINGSFYIQGASDVTIRGGSAGGTEGVHSDIVDWSHNPEGVVAPQNITIDGVYFHDMIMEETTDHVECLQISGGNTIKILNSHFHHCDTFDIHAGDNQTQLQNVTIENNIFEASTDRFNGSGRYGLSIRSGTNVVIRNNTSNQDWAGPSPTDRVSSWTFENNLFGSGGCPRSSTINYNHNFWYGDTPNLCGTADDSINYIDKLPVNGVADNAQGRPENDPTDGNGLEDSTGKTIDQTVGWADYQDGDFHLTEDSPAIDVGNAVSGHFALFDIDGNTRYAGAAPDAGAYEYGILLGDLDQDSDIDEDDLDALKSSYGSNVTPGEDGDLNGDGKVTVRDLSILLRNWTQ